MPGKPGIFFYFKFFWSFHLVVSKQPIIFVKQNGGATEKKGLKNNMTAEQATILIQQLGGNRFKTMTGAKNFVRGEISETNPTAWLRMDLPKNPGKVNRLKITLNANDTYTMFFYKMVLSKKTFEVAISNEQSFEDVYCDQLQEIFTSVTKFHTSL